MIEKDEINYDPDFYLSSDSIQEDQFNSDPFPVVKNDDPQELDSIDEEEKETVLKAYTCTNELENIPYAKNTIEKPISKSEMEAIIEDINMYIKFDDEKIQKHHSLIADDYLPIVDEYLNEEIINSEFEILLNRFDLSNDLKKLKFQIEKSQLDLSGRINCNIGPVSSLDFLVEASFNHDSTRKKSMIENLICLEDTIYTWRKIGGDGNCYYRSVIFGYLENIILNKDLTLLKAFIIDLNKLFFTEEYLMRIMAHHGIKPDLVLKILISIYLSLKIDIGEAYELYLKCFNNCKAFDLGLILYFRFKLYQFIKANEDKLYTTSFSVKIGNLLPIEFETEEGSFLYDRFYEEYLMKLYKDAEKIVIYLTPFVLKINLKILVYDFGKSHIEKTKDFPFNIDSLNRLTITLLYKKTHYDLIYQKEYFEIHMKYLTRYVNLGENLEVIDTNSLKEAKKIKLENKLNIIQFKEESKVIPVSVKAEVIEDINWMAPSNKCSQCKREFVSYQNRFKLCRECLLSEVKTNTLSKYFEFIAASRMNFQTKKEESDAVRLFSLIFLETGIKIGNEMIPSSDAFKLIETDMESFFRGEIKSKICINCEAEINTKGSTLSYFTLPCYCLLCSKNCMKSFFSLLFSVAVEKRRKSFICICSTSYNTNDLKNLLLFCHSNNCKTHKEKVVEIFKERIKSDCMLCYSSLDFNSKGVFQCEIKDDEINKLCKLNNLTHFICSDCYDDHFKEKNGISLGRHQYCIICDKVHSLANVKWTSAKKKESECLFQ